MRRSLRPVKEVWGQGASSFLNPSNIIRVLQIIADRIESEHEATPYGDVMVFRVESGTAFLNYIEKNPGCTTDSIADEISDAGGVTISSMFAPVSMADMGDRDSPVDKADLAVLIENLRWLAPAWRKSIDEYGGLRFYVDA